jgi:hypothetical protein
MVFQSILVFIEAFWLVIQFIIYTVQAKSEGVLEGRGWMKKRGEMM